MNQLTLFAANCNNTICFKGVPRGDASQNTITHIITIVLMTLAALAILFVVIGGIRYILSQGDPQAISKAKSTIIYSLVGLVVVISAQAIVSFVISKL